MIDIPHFSFPFSRSIDGTSVNVDEQDREEEIMSCENVIVRCPQGFRFDRPEFGWEFPVFRQQPLDLAPLEEALERLEPRGAARASQYADAADQAVRHIQVDVGVRDA